MFLLDLSGSWYRVYCTDILEASPFKKSVPAQAHSPAWAGSLSLQSVSL